MKKRIIAELNWYDKLRIGLTFFFTVGMIVGDAFLFVRFYTELIEAWWSVIALFIGEYIAVRMMLLGSYCVMTIKDTAIKMNSAVAVHEDMRTQLVVTDSKDLYIKEVEYTVGKHGLKTEGLLLSKYPIKEAYDIEKDGYDSFSIVIKYSVNFLNALKENFNCHFIGEIKE